MIIRGKFYDKVESVCFLILSFLIALSAVFGYSMQTVRAEKNETKNCQECTYSLDQGIELIGKEIINGSVVENFSDGSVLTGYSDGILELTVPISSSFVSDEQREKIFESTGQIQARSYIAMVRIFLEVAGGIFTTCSIIEWLSNYTFNPCAVARQYLASQARTGRYVVEGEYIPGRVPGCEPMNSLPCNSGYYRYRFIPE